MRFIPVISVPRAVMETLEKALAGKMKRRTWVRDSTGRKGHYRMQWVNPENDLHTDNEKQIDLFSDAVKTAAPKKEKEAAADFKVYHDSFTSVVDEVIKNLEKRGFYMDEEDVWDQISMGPGKPKDGRTDRYNMPLYDKDGKPAKKGVAFQVADLGSRYELNMYVTPYKEKDYTKEKAKVRVADKPEAGPEPEKPESKKNTHDVNARWKQYKTAMEQLDQEKGWPAATSEENIEKRKNLVALRKEMKDVLGEAIHDTFITDEDFSVGMDQMTKKIEMALGKKPAAEIVKKSAIESFRDKLTKAFGMR